MNGQPKSRSVRPYQPGTIEKLVWNIKLVWRLMKDRRVSFWLKLLPILGILWLILPDIAPGTVDDALAVYFASSLFIELCPKSVVSEHRREIRQSESGPDSKVIDGEFKDVD